MMNLLDESGLQKLVDLLTDDFVFFLVEAAQALFHWPGAGPDLQGVLGDFPRYARHIRGTPCKYVDIHTENVDEHGFLFGIEGGANLQRPPVQTGRVERYELDVFRGFEVAGMAFGVRDLLGQTIEVCCQGC
jgi:hypothetical protein